MTTNDAQKAVEAKALVIYKFEGETVFYGIAENLSADGWIDIRQPHDGNRVDAAPAVFCEFDPT
jgi:hypothetical protein